VCDHLFAAMVPWLASHHSDAGWCRVSDNNVAEGDISSVFHDELVGEFLVTLTVLRSTPSTFLSILTDGDAGVGGSATVNDLAQFALVLAPNDVVTVATAVYVPGVNVYSVGMSMLVAVDGCVIVLTIAPDAFRTTMV
jgi:hypothetical protein